MGEQLFAANTDAFMDMPFSAQALYFHLKKSAGAEQTVIPHPKAVVRMLGATEADFVLLVREGFVRQDERGQWHVCVFV